MTDRPDGSAHDAAREGRGIDGPDIDELTREILPALIARLRASRLGELEVRTADWRVRVRRDLRAARRATPAGGTGAAAGEATGDDGDPRAGPARSPAVGYFKPLPGLSVGQLVQAGDVLGSVDMLGIAQDVLAPRGGIVRAILAEPGQAVEYGQTLVEIDVLAVDAVAPETGMAAAADGGAADDAGIVVTRPAADVRAASETGVSGDIGEPGGGTEVRSEPGTSAEETAATAS